MTDIVEMLRKTHSGKTLDVACELTDLCDAAADEIERLREELELKRRVLGWLIVRRPDGSVWINYDEQAVFAVKTYFELAAKEGEK